MEQLDVSDFAPDLFARIAIEKPGWQVEDGACPTCTRRVLVLALLELGDASLYERIQSRWSLRPDIAFGALPLHIRLHTDPRFSGKGITMAFVDSGFYPHPDLTRPNNRIRAWVDAGQEPPVECRFGPNDTPTWDKWDAGLDSQWHGTMTSTVAAGNGWQSHGIYSGLAGNVDVVLVQVRDETGAITNETITRALDWLQAHRQELNLRIISMSVAGDPLKKHELNVVDRAIAALVKDGVVVVAAAGNDGVRRLIPPATARDALTIGGIDDHNEFHPDDLALWHSNYGLGDDRHFKPELVAPSIWVAAPLLPSSAVATEARELFARRRRGDSSAQERTAALKLVTAHYQSVDGTSFAAPIVSSLVASMLEANPTLTPEEVREILLGTASFVEGAPRERQGAGVIQPSQAIAAALRAPGGPLANFPDSLDITANGIQFVLYDHDANQVQVMGSWNDWRAPASMLSPRGNGVWIGGIDPLPPGQYSYKFLLDGVRWLDDPANPRKIPDSYGGWNSLFVVH